jgi:hypothetical protein
MNEMKNLYRSVRRDLQSSVTEDDFNLILAELKTAAIDDTSYQPVYDRIMDRVHEGRIDCINHRRHYEYSQR